MTTTMLKVFEMGGSRARKYLDDGYTRKEALQQATEDLQRLISPGLGERENGGGLGLMCSSAASCGLAWLETSFATVHLGHKLAASLCCTSIPEECANEIAPPFRCFALIFPDGLLSDLSEGFFLQARDGLVYFHVAGPRAVFGYEIRCYTDEDLHHLERSALEENTARQNDRSQAHCMPLRRLRRNDASGTERVRREDQEQA
jgi:hypothetical protein